MAFPAVTDAFCLENLYVPIEKECFSFDLIEKFVCVLYDHTTNEQTSELAKTSAIYTW